MVIVFSAEPVVLLSSPWLLPWLQDLPMRPEAREVSGHAPIATASRDRTAALWSEAGSRLQVLELKGQAPSGVAWRADRKALPPGGEEGGWVLWPLDPLEGARA